MALLRSAVESATSAVRIGVLPTQDSEAARTLYSVLRTQLTSKAWRYVQALVAAPSTPVAELLHAADITLKTMVPVPPTALAWTAQFAHPAMISNGRLLTFTQEEAADFDAAAFALLTEYEMQGGDVTAYYVGNDDGHMKARALLRADRAAGTVRQKLPPQIQP